MNARPKFGDLPKASAIPKAANSLNKLAYLYINQGDYTRLVTHFIRPVEIIYEISLGAEHPLTRMARRKRDIPVLWNIIRHFLPGSVKLKRAALLSFAPARAESCS